MITLFASLTLGQLLFGGSGTLHTVDAAQFTRCAGAITRVVNPKPAQVSKLGDLPDAHMELPVVRIVQHDHACRAAPLIVRYNVSR